MKKIAFVTEANSGLGLGITLRLLQKGWSVFAGQDGEEPGELPALEEKYPESLHIVSLDVSSDESVREAAGRVAEETGHMDMLISNAGIGDPAASEKTIREKQDFDELLRVYNTNALGGLRMAEAFLPLLDKGSMKRLCFLSSEAGSINFCCRTSAYGYCMSKAALHMGVKILFNRLRPEGYTFRLYHPGWVYGGRGAEKNMAADRGPEAAGADAAEYFIRNRSLEPENPGHSDENRLVMRDRKGSEWPW